MIRINDYIINEQLIKYAEEQPANSLYYIENPKGSINIHFTDGTMKTFQGISMDDLENKLQKYKSLSELANELDTSEPKEMRSIRLSESRCRI